MAKGLFSIVAGRIVYTALKRRERGLIRGATRLGKNQGIYLSTEDGVLLASGES